jgi:hypothetical protein
VVAEVTFCVSYLQLLLSYDWKNKQRDDKKIADEKPYPLNYSHNKDTRKICMINSKKRKERKEEKIHTFKEKKLITPTERVSLH